MTKKKGFLPVLAAALILAGCGPTGLSTSSSVQASSTASESTSTSASSSVGASGSHTSSESSESQSSESAASSESSTSEEPVVDTATLLENVSKNVSKIKSGTVKTSTADLYEPENEPDVVTTPFEYGDDTFHYTSYDYSGKPIEHYVIPDGNGGYIPLLVDSAGKLSRDYNEYEQAAYKFTGILDYESIFYGPEGLLSDLYEIGKQNINGDFAEKDGNFSFSYFYNDEGSVYNLYSLSVSYTLTEDEVLTQLNVRRLFYTSMSFTYDPELNRVFLNDGATPNSDITYTVDQTVGTRDFETDYSVDTLVPQSYDIFCDGKKLEDGSTIEIMNGSSATLTPQNILPATASLGFDNVEFTSSDQDGLQATFSSYSGDFNLYSNKVGTYDVTIKGINVSKSFKVEVLEPAPESINATYWISSIDGYESNTLPSKKSLYVDSTMHLAVNVVPYAAQQLYTIAIEGDQTGYEIVDETFKPSEYADEMSAKALTFTKAGVYKLTIASQVDPAVSFTSELTVSEAPEFNELLSGTYMYKSVPGKDVDYQVDFTPDADGKTGKVTITDFTDEYSGKAKIETLAYSLTETDGAFNIDLTHESGDELPYKLVLGADYKLGIVETGLYYDSVYALYRPTNEFYASGAWQYAPNGYLGLSIDLTLNPDGTFGTNASDYSSDDYFYESGSGTYTFTENADGTFTIVLTYEPDEGYVALKDGAVLVCNADFTKLTGETYVSGAAESIVFEPYDDPYGY